jgi:hypothetical protein
VPCDPSYTVNGNGLSTDRDRAVPLDCAPFPYETVAISYGQCHQSFEDWGIDRPVLPIPRSQVGALSTAVAMLIRHVATIPEGVTRRLR